MSSQLRPIELKPRLSVAVEAEKANVDVQRGLEGLLLIEKETTVPCDG